MAKLYTKNGDNGETFLLFGKKVSKLDARVQCYGAIDECISNLGAAYSLSVEKDDKDISDMKIYRDQILVKILEAKIAMRDNGKPEEE